MYGILTDQLVRPVEQGSMCGAYASPVVSGNVNGTAQRRLPLAFQRLGHRKRLAKTPRKNLLSPLKRG